MNQEEVLKANSFLLTPSQKVYNTRGRQQRLKL